MQVVVKHKLKSQGGDHTMGTVPCGCYSLTARNFSVSERFVRKIWKLYCNGAGMSPKIPGCIKGNKQILSDELLVTSNPTIY